MKWPIKVIVLLSLLVSQTLFAQSFNGFDLSNSLVDINDIVQGGPPRDGIPALSKPNYVSASDVDFLKPDDIVLGFTIGSQAFAYPRHILNWHEIVNEQIDEQAFVITYCPLCGSGMAFSSSIKSRSLSFGVSGLLYNNDLIFYDRQTESLWSQLERRAISGEFVGSGLQQLPLQHTSWSAWSKQYPKTKVLSEDQGYKRNYRHDPYTGYDTSSQVFFKTLRDAPSDFHSKEKILGLSVGGQAKAYPFSELRRNGIARFKDQLGDVKYAVIWDDESGTARLEAGNGEPLTATVAYWFAWYNFHPKTEVFKAE